MAPGCGAVPRAWGPSDGRGARRVGVDAGPTCPGHPRHGFRPRGSGAAILHLPPAALFGPAAALAAPGRAHGPWRSTRRAVPRGLRPTRGARGAALIVGQKLGRAAVTALPAACSLPAEALSAGRFPQRPAPTEGPRARGRPERHAQARRRGCSTTRCRRADRCGDWSR